MTNDLLEKWKERFEEIVEYSDSEDPPGLELYDKEFLEIKSLLEELQQWRNIRECWIYTNENHSNPLIFWTKEEALEFANEIKLKKVYETPFSIIFHLPPLTEDHLIQIGKLSGAKKQ